MYTEPCADRKPGESKPALRRSNPCHWSPRSEHSETSSPDAPALPIARAYEPSRTSATACARVHARAHTCGQWRIDRKRTLKLPYVVGRTPYATLGYQFTRESRQTATDALGRGFAVRLTTYDLGRNRAEGRWLRADGRHKLQCPPELRLHALTGDNGIHHPVLQQESASLKPGGSFWRIV